MARFNNLWNTVERLSIYVIGVLFILIQILVKLFPSLNEYIDQQIVLVLIGLMILFSFRYIDKNLSLQQRTDVFPIRKFTTDIVKVLEDKKINKLCIFASNGFKYHHAILESGIQIKELKVLLRDFDNLENVQFPSDPDIKNSYKQSCDQLLKSFCNLANKENIGNISVHTYQFDSILHFMILDDKLVHFGLLKPINEFPGLETLNSFVITNESINGRELISNFSQEFNTIFSEYSQPVHRDNQLTK